MDPLYKHVFDRLEHFYDAVPATTPVRRSMAGWCCSSARGRMAVLRPPRVDASEPPSLADVSAVRERQRKLGLPEAFEWVHDTAPELLSVARSAG
ncbi:hypothetical protein NKG94_47875 [Micromonospora sp. M12]